MKGTLAKAVTHREFLKMCGLALVGAGAAQVAAPKTALAADGNFDNLYVTGNAQLATSSGKVGIGTTSPGALLDVVGGGGSPLNDAIQNSRPDYPQLILRATNAGGNNKIWRFIGRSDGTSQIQTLDDGYGSEVTLIGMVRSGKVGIGTTAPDTTLHLGSGALKIGLRVIADSDGSYYA